MPVSHEYDVPGLDAWRKAVMAVHAVAHEGIVSGVPVLVYFQGFADSFFKLLGWSSSRQERLEPSDFAEEKNFDGCCIA